VQAGPDRVVQRRAQLAIGVEAGTAALLAGQEGDQRRLVRVVRETRRRRGAAPSGTRASIENKASSAARVARGDPRSSGPAPRQRRIPRCQQQQSGKAGGQEALAHR
jgi:hypothetical protein